MKIDDNGEIRDMTQEEEAFWSAEHERFAAEMQSVEVSKE